MASDELTELNDLKEIAIGKIKAAFNRSIDAEATHSVLWDTNEKRRNTLLKFGLLISIFIIIIGGGGIILYFIAPEKLISYIRWLGGNL